MGPFFVPDNEFCFVQTTTPVFFGVEYKKSTESTWRKPEINHEPYYEDHQGIKESAAVVIDPDTRVYQHIETEAGIHDYAMYSINWFSRVSTVSNTVETDETVFPVKNTLIPPLNFAAQLIQHEDVLLFTTQQEQDALAAIQGDNTYVRVTFGWDHINIRNYPNANLAEFFFRQDPPQQVTGQVASDPVQSGPDLYDVHTKGYTLQSTNGGTITPSIAAGDESKFAGSLFSAGDGKKFAIISVKQSTIDGEGPVFTISPIKDKAVIDATSDSSGQYTPSKQIVLPQANDLFTVVENASVDTDWPVKLSQNVQLIHFSDHTETIHFNDPDMADEVVTVGGIYESASITEFPDKGPDGNFIPGSRTGLYSIRFDTYQLSPHPDSKVSWHRGSVRIALGNYEIRTLEVWDIDLSESTLTLTAYDNTFDVDSSYIPINNYVPMPVGSGIFVNYHPGYKVYLRAETGFDNGAILPAAGTGKKLTYMSCRSDDTTVPLYSFLAPLATLMAREIVPPEKPHKPSGPLFATRPDFYGKATYTFDTEMETNGNTRLPYGLIFYRCDAGKILNTLYQPDTVASILANPTIMDVTNFTDIWNEFVNVSGPNNYIDLFPNPDNNSYSIPDPDPSRTPVYPFDGTKGLGDATTVPNTAALFGGSDVSFTVVVQNAINGAFLPLTEQPVVYEFIQDGYQTSGKKPVIRSSNGDLLDPGTPDFDPFPMAVTFNDANGNPFVRFTDYTLDGASTSVYFYFVIEMTNTLALGDRSDILGPIHLVNSLAPQPPGIKKVTSQPANPLTGDVTAVLFEINNYLDSDDIDQILIYRAYNVTDALNTRTMALATTIQYGDPIMDDFSDLTYLPFGETLFYRLVALRKIKNEYGEDEHIPSLPSRQVLTNIIDVFNPDAPDLSYTGTPTLDSSGNPTLISDVVLQWNKTAYNGTYYLYQLNNSGNWTKLYEVNSNDDTMQYSLGDITKQNEDGDTLYYQYKVDVQNASGLLNLTDNEYTI